MARWVNFVPTGRRTTICTKMEEIDLNALPIILCICTGRFTEKRTTLRHYVSKNFVEIHTLDRGAKCLSCIWDRLTNSRRSALAFIKNTKSSRDRGKGLVVENFGPLVRGLNHSLKESGKNEGQGDDMMWCFHFPP